MLTSNEIFAQMPVETANGLLTFVQESEKPLYKATIENLATQRKLRPVFIERKPKLERYAWLKDALARRAAEGIAAHLLQIWLIGAHKNVLCDFLDSLGIAHDENGTLNELPAAPDKAAVAKAVDALLEKHDRGVVAVYLNAFQALDEKGWDSLEEILKEDERLKLAAPVAA